MIYSREFFDLQLAFAERARLVADISRERALLDYTNLYVRFGCGRDFDPEHPRWREYLAGLVEASSPLDWTMDFYGREAEQQTAPRTDLTVGCFSAAIGAEKVRLHFRNAVTTDESPLSSSHISARRGELAELFRLLQSTVSETTPVVGTSWLYNLSAYRRLFPQEYLATASTLWDRFRSMPLWGQFVDRRGELREEQVQSFRYALQATTSTSRLSQCFPLQVITVSAPARCFNEHAQ